TKNRYYDDKLWLALAMGRVSKLPKMSRPKGLVALLNNILEGRDKSFGVLPWREGETFLNVPTNGPAAIMLARMGRIDEARHIVDWFYDILVDDDVFIMDGLSMRMRGPDLVGNTHPYCQGVVLGACLAAALALSEDAAVDSLEQIDSARDAEHADETMPYLTRIRGLV